MATSSSQQIYNKLNEAQAEFHRKQASYWRRRMEIMSEAQNKKSDTLVSRTKARYKTVQKQLRQEINDFYARFAANNDMTYAEAMKVLNADELAEFKWNLNEFMEKAAEANPEWEKQLENASIKQHISRLEAVETNIDNILETLAADNEKALSGLLSGVYEDTYLHTAYEVQVGTGIASYLQAPNTRALQKALTKPWTLEADTFSDRIRENKRLLKQRLATHLTQMIIGGESRDKVIDTLMKDLKVDEHKAVRLVTTETAAFENMAQVDSFKDAGVKKLEIIGTLDSTTCRICGALDGVVFDVTDGQQGLNLPPFHPYCRCCTAPYSDDWTKDGERVYRDGDERYYIPEDMPYTEWKERFVDKTKNNKDLEIAPSGVPTSRGKAKAEAIKEFRITNNPSLIDAVKNTNPNYKGALGEYGQNCQRCVVASELRRRGYDVIANPAIVDKNGKLSRKDKLANNWRLFFKDAKWVRYHGQGDLELKMSKDPIGARYVLSVEWSNSNITESNGHAFSAEKTKDGIIYYDSQNGVINCEKYFTLTKRSSIFMTRVDNLEITELGKRCVTNRGGKT